MFIEHLLGMPRAAAGVKEKKDAPEQWFSTFLMRLPLKAVPHAVTTTSHKITFIATHNCDFATVRNCSVNVCVFQCERVV